MADMKLWKEKSKKLKNKFGDGRVGLIDLQKNERIKLRLGTEFNKIKRFNKEGVTLLNKGIKRDFIIPENHKGPVDVIPKDIITNLSKYPLDLCDPSRERRIIAVEVKSDGSMIVSGIVKDGNETKLIGRRHYSVIHLPDELALRNTKNNFKKGNLKEIEPRMVGLLNDEELEEMLGVSEISNKTTENIAKLLNIS